MVCETTGFEGASESIAGLVAESQGSAPEVFQAPARGFGGAAGVWEWRIVDEDVRPSALEGAAQTV